MNININSSSLSIIPCISISITLLITRPYRSASPPTLLVSPPILHLVEGTGPKSSRAAPPTPLPSRPPLPHVLPEGGLPRRTLHEPARGRAVPGLTDLPGLENGLFRILPRLSLPLAMIMKHHHISRRKFYHYLPHPPLRYHRRMVKVKVYR